MLPKTLALIEPDSALSQLLAANMRARGVQVDVFGNSTDLLVHPEAFEFEFYVPELTLDGMGGLELVRLLRRRTAAGIVVMTSEAVAEVFGPVMTAGADMLLAKPVRVGHVALAVEAVLRRGGASGVEAAGWKLDRRAHELVAPDGARIALGDTDLVLLQCFADAGGAVVTRDTLVRVLDIDPSEHADKTLNAIVYRLRKRIGRATPAIAPLQSQSRVGYVFRAPLKLA